MTIIITSIIISISRYNEDEKKRLEEETRINQIYTWPEDGVSDCLPKPETIYGEINYNTVRKFSITLYQISHEEFNTYITKCVDNGFKENEKVASTSYKAYNQDGYFLYINYHNSEVDIEVIAPIIMDYSAEEILNMGMLYDQAEAFLRERGFINIEIVENIGNLWKDDGEMKSVSINGISNFEQGSTFRYDAKIIITYYK